MDTEILKEYGIDYEKGLARCADDPEFFALLLSMFLEDDSFARGKSAYEKGDQQAFFACMHELKGVSGTASLTALYEATCPLVELLRGEAPGKEREDALFAAVEKAYACACKGIALASEG